MHVELITWKQGAHKNNEQACFQCVLKNNKKCEFKIIIMKNKLLKFVCNLCVSTMTLPATSLVNLIINTPVTHNKCMQKRDRSSTKISCRVSYTHTPTAMHQSSNQREKNGKI